MSFLIEYRPYILLAALVGMIFSAERMAQKKALPIDRLSSRLFGGLRANHARAGDKNAGYYQSCFE